MPSQWEDKSKPHRNIVFVGHVDGKSTTVGRLLLDSGHIEAHVIEKNEKLAAEAGKAGFGLAYVMDGLKEERERGITIDVAHKEFFTLSTTGASLTLQVTETSSRTWSPVLRKLTQRFSSVLQTTVSTHKPRNTLSLLRFLELRNSSSTLTRWTFLVLTGPRTSTRQLLAKSLLLKMAGFGSQLDNIPMIPASSLNGDNVFEKSDKCPWYNGNSLRGY